jgi:hypothetical protein
MIFKRRTDPRESVVQAIPSWVLEVDPERARYDVKLLMELFMAAFLSRSTPYGVMQTVREQTPQAVTGSPFPPRLREALQRTDSPATLPNYFFLCYAEDVVDPAVASALRGFEANFARVHRPRLKEVAMACIAAVPSFLETWFIARGAADGDEPRPQFFQREYECGLRVLPCRSRDDLPLPGREVVQILPKVSALVLVQNALAVEPGRGTGPVPRVSTRLEVLSPGRREPRIHKFVLHERIGDPSPQRLYLTDSEPEWWFTVGSREWDDVYVPDLPCRAELRVALRSNPAAPTEPAVADVTARVQPPGSQSVQLATHLEQGVARSRFLPFEMQAVPASPENGAGKPVIVRVVSMEKAFPVREILNLTRLYNPVLRLAGRLLPLPLGTGRRFGKPIPGRGGRGTGGLNRISDNTQLGTVDLGALVLGLDGDTPYLEVTDPNAERAIQLVRGGSIAVLQGRTPLQGEDRVRIISGDERLDLVWRPAGDGRFLEGIEDVFAGGLMLERGERTAEQFVWVGAYEELGPGRGPEDAATCYVVCRGSGGHVPSWPEEDASHRVATACLVGDPYLSGEGSFGFMLSAQDGRFHTRMLAGPRTGDAAARTFFRAPGDRWHPWTGLHSGALEQGGAWHLSTVEETWSSQRKLQEFIVGSSLFDITLSGTL